MSGLTDDMRFNIEFAKEVQRHPCLYDKSHGEYNNKPSSDNAWKLIGEKFSGLNAIEIRKKYRSIRSAYVRSLRQQKDYYLAPYLGYLRPYTKVRPNDENSKDDLNIEFDMESENDDSASQSDDDCTMIDTERTKFEDDSDKDDDSKEYTGNIQVSALPELRKNHGKVVKIKGTQPKIFVSHHTQYATPTLSPSEYYLKSLLPDVSSMNPRQFFLFRKGILSIIGKLKYSKDPPETES